MPSPGPSGGDARQPARRAEGARPASLLGRLFASVSGSAHRPAIVIEPLAAPRDLRPPVIREAGVRPSARQPVESFAFEPVGEREPAIGEPRENSEGLEASLRDPAPVEAEPIPASIPDPVPDPIPTWRKPFSLPPNVRFTRTPDRALRARPPIQPVAEPQDLHDQDLHDQDLHDQDLHDQDLHDPDLHDQDLHDQDLHDQDLHDQDLHDPDSDGLALAPASTTLVVAERVLPDTLPPIPLSHLPDVAFWHAIAGVDAFADPSPEPALAPVEPVPEEAERSRKRGRTAGEPRRKAKASATAQALLDDKPRERRPVVIHLPDLDRSEDEGADDGAQNAPALALAPPLDPDADDPPFDIVPALPAPALSRRVIDRRRPRDLPQVVLRPRAAIEAVAFELPPIELLAEPELQTETAISPEALEQNARLLEGVLEDFGVRGEIIHVRPGPVVTLYELEPAPGTKSSRVIALADDIARSMSASRPASPWSRAATPSASSCPTPSARPSTCASCSAAQDFETSKHKLALCLGKTIGGEPVIADLASMPHLLVAGTTGSGKSVAINTMILSLLYRLTPEECRLIMVDPKMLELSVYDGIPHLLTPVVTDPKKAVIALKWAVREMEERYKKMSKLGVRNIDGFNARVAEAARRRRGRSRARCRPASTARPARRSTRTR